LTFALESCSFWLLVTIKHVKDKHWRLNKDQKALCFNTEETEPCIPSLTLSLALQCLWLQQKHRKDGTIKKDCVEKFLFYNQCCVWFQILPQARFVTPHKLFKQSKPEFPHL
jgi:hypothetical protein